MNFSVALKGDKIKLTDAIFVYQAKPVASILDKEPFMNRGQILKKISLGKSGEVLRNKIIQRNDTDINKIADQISNVLGHEVMILYKNRDKKDTDEYIDMQIRIGDKDLDIHLQGSGFLQVAEIFSTIDFLSNTSLNLLLIDEPDSHIHVKSQRKLLNEIKKISNVQSFIISHNDNFIDKYIQEKNNKSKNIKYFWVTILVLFIIFAGVLFTIFVKSPEYTIYSAVSAMKANNYEKTIKYINIEKIVNNRFEAVTTEMMNDPALDNNPFAGLAYMFVEAVKPKFVSIVQDSFKNIVESPDNIFQEVSTPKLLIFLIIKNYNGITLVKTQNEPKKVIFAEGTQEINVSQNFFYGCAVEEVVLPESVKKIGDYAFSEIAALKEINLPDSITEIGTEAFRKCSGLTNIKLPEGLTALGGRAFAECENLAEIYIPAHLTDAGGYIED